jgi:hypothetical protein
MMTDTNAPPPSGNPVASDTQVALRRAELSARPIGFMINMITGIAGVISLGVVFGAVGIAATGGTVPEVLSNWGGIILGFYFGQFVNLAKDYMGVISNAPPR